MTQAPSSDAPLTLSSLPLFPLGTVLFPGGVLPLRVFEVRYLDMITRCHRAGAPFGVVALRQGSEVRQAGAADVQLWDSGTLAQIETFEQPQAGLILLRCTGLQRFHLTATHQLKHGLWVGDVALMPADAAVAIPDDLRGAADALRQLAAAIQASGRPSPIPDSPQWDDAGWVANRWCELLPMPLAQKQQLLTLDSPLLRLELVNDMVAKAMAPRG